MSSELKLLEKVQNKKSQKTPVKMNKTQLKKSGCALIKSV